MSKHLHIYFSPWLHESRAFRAGKLAFQTGYASQIDYIGYSQSSLPPVEHKSSFERIIRLPVLTSPPGSLRILRSLSLPKWYLSCLREIPMESVSLIVAHSLAALPISAFFAYANNIPLLYDAHELETERSGWSFPIRCAAKVIESFLIPFCTAITVPSDAIRDHYSANYPNSHVTTIRNLPIIPSEIHPYPLKKVLGIPDQAALFVYCGSFGSGRGLNLLIEAFRGLDSSKRLLLVGYGPNKEYLMSQASDSPNIYFHDAVPHKDLIPLLSGADVGVIVPSTDSLSYKYALPNKLFEYAAAKIAIIAGDGPEVIRFASSYPAS